MEIVSEEVQHSNQIITDLVGFARVSPPSLSATNLGAVIEETLSSIELRDNVRIVKRLDPDLPAVMADGDQLRQRVFMNLAMNAQDAMPDGGELTISTQKAAEFVEVAFTDSGIGIYEDTLPKIFEPLFSTKSRGTGLGLSVCHQIVSNHGGNIDVVSAKGHGSTFTVRLPLNDAGA